MRLKLFLLFVFTLSAVFSQNTNTLSNRINTDLYDSDSSKSMDAARLEKFHDPLNKSMNADAQFLAENLNINTAKSNLERHRIWLNMTNTGGAFKQILIGYIEGATNGLDRNFDGLSLDANPYIDFYSVISESNLVIQGRALPFSDADEVQLGYRTILTGDFTISIDHADGLLTHQPVFLEDKLTNTIHDLRVSGYTFATTTGTFKNRFVLRYKNQTLTTYDLEKKNNHVSVWIDNESININSALENIDKVFVYTISGKLIYTDNSVLANETIINGIKSNNEILLMKIILKGNQIETKKIIY
ncbi:T9SS sorting signal type C domain-containing protein [Flavobacterium piscis]|uniref:Uncharacterized protein n=1 Tax=Flavobacterium piscis TaxID=1114874 RepID=A0ABU1YEK2_9FLAO|nr:T9SS sorting signal type C domain-containing protein [Flavobacterium piscis]MDR7212674.1 hypothetical protein [Flavobacterium piscis]